jgi:hypothetical protein
MATAGKVRERSFAGLEHMSRDHFAAFGMIVTMTSHLDALFDQIIVAMTESANKPAFYPILTFLSAKDKRDYIQAMARISTWPPYAIDGIMRLMDRAKTVFSLRNDVAHLVWRKGRKPGTIKPMSLSARSVLKVLGSEHNEREWTAAQLEAEAHKIHELGLELARFMDRYGLVALPEKPPPRSRRADKPRSGP